MQEETKKHNIKIVYSLEQNTCQKKIYSDCHLKSISVRGAELFLNAFSPEQLLRSLANQQENAVLVFRTSESQMQEFCNFPVIHKLLEK